MTLNLRHKNWEPTGRISEKLDELDQPTGELVWSGALGEQQIHDGADWQPYIWDSDTKELRYSNDDFRCEFSDTHQVIKKASTLLCRKLQFYVDVEHPTNPGTWLPAPHGAPERNILHNKRYKNKQLVDAEGYCIGHLNFPDAELPNTTPYTLQLGIQAGRKRRALLGFRFNTTISGRVRFQIVKDGLKPGTIQDFTLLKSKGGPSGNEERTVGVKYKDVEFRWTWAEAAYHTVSVEDSTAYPGEKKGIITVGPFDYTAGEWIDVVPLTWGLTEVSDDANEINSTTIRHGSNYYIMYMGDYAAAVDAGWVWGNVTAEGTAGNGCYIRLNVRPDRQFQEKYRNN